MFRMVQREKLYNGFVKGFALVLSFFLMGCCITGCGSAGQTAEVMKPNVERIPQDGSENGSEEGGVAGGRDALALTVEAMQEDGKDTSLVEGKIETKGLSFELPEGFFESKDIPGMYVTRRYPLDAANIYYLEKEADPVMQYMTKEDYEEIVREKLNIGLPKNFRITEFKERKFDGIPGFRVKSSYTYNDLTITQTEYIVNADKTYILTYTMTNEYDRSDWFAASERSIRVIK